MQTDSSKAKRYTKTKRVIATWRAVFSFAVLLAFIAAGFSSALESWLAGYIEHDYLRFFAFAFVLGAGMAILFYPLSYYSGFYLEHKYELSTQTFFKWTLDGIKAMLVSTALGLPVMLLFFYFIRESGELWWFWFAVFLFFFSVVLMRILPVLILPLFYKIVPLDESELKQRIREMSEAAGLRVENVYSFNMSRETKKANAAFTGIGKSKRVLLGDTLLDAFTEDEVETVVAHELGHYRRKHLVKQVAFSTVSSFVTLFLINVLYAWSLPWFGFTAVDQIAALPLLSLWAMVIGFLKTPIGSALSRKHEYEADEYAVRETGKGEAFKGALERLAKQNLADPDPPAFIEWFFYSHPSITKRVRAVDALSGAPPSSPAEAGFV